MSYSNNIYKLLKQEEDGKLIETVEKYKKDIAMEMNRKRIEDSRKPEKPQQEIVLPDFEKKYNDEKRVKLKFKDPAKRAEYEALPLKDQLLFEKYALRMKQLKEEETPSDKTYSAASPETSDFTISPIINGKFSTESPYVNSEYNPNTPPEYNPNTPPDYMGTDSPRYNPNSPEYAPASPAYPSGTSEEDIKPITSDNILQLEEEKKETDKESENEKEKEGEQQSGGVKKVISFDLKPDIIKLP
jgi:hypothetical protein